MPGLQGRWEWAKPALTELARTCRTISYTLSGDIGSGSTLQPELGFENYTRQLEDVLERAGLEAGGHLWRVLRRVRGFEIRGAPSGTRLGADPRVRSRSRMAPEPAAGGLDLPALVVNARVPGDVAAPGLAGGERGAAPRRVPAGVPRAPGAALPGGADDSVADGSDEYSCTAGIDFDDDCRRVSSPTLVVSGEEPLDRVVPVGSTRKYAKLIPRADYRVLPHTGHMAILTRPSMFAGLVSDFAHAHHH